MPESSRKALNSTRSRKGAPAPYDSSDPVAVLKAFMREMNDWEIRAAQAVKGLEGPYRTGKELRPFFMELARIFDRYCTPQKDRQGKQQIRPIPMAPTYDLARQEIVEIRPKPRKRVEIHVHDNTVPPYPHLQHIVFTLLRTEAGWRLEKKRWLNKKGKPTMDYL